MNDKITIDSSTLVQSVDWTIKNRKTQKVLADAAHEPQLTPDEIQQLDVQVKEAIDVSGWAPFHYDRRVDGVAEPWRYALVLHQSCRQLAKDFDTIFDDVKPSNKLPKMLMACGALVLVTWLPESDTSNPKLAMVNEEHLAAAAAATQNLMLALEARGLGTYWSSGGLLRSPSFLEQYGLNPESRLIAAVFVNYPGMYPSQGCEIIAGKNRSNRSEWNRWTKVIE